MKLKIATILVFLQALVSPAFSQACGYTYAQFDVRDSRGKVVRNAEFQFLKGDSNKIAFVPETFRWVEVDSHYFLAQGLWGGYRNVLIRVAAKGFVSAGRTFDLPLTNHKNPLRFQIRLSRIGTRGRSSFELLDVEQPS